MYYFSDISCILIEKYGARQSVAIVRLLVSDIIITVLSYLLIEFWDGFGYYAISHTGKSRVEIPENANLELPAICPI